MWVAWRFLKDSRGYWPFLLRGLADRIEGDEGQPGPGYAAVSIHRWESHTGRQAELVSG